MDNCQGEDHIGRAALFKRLPFFVAPANAGLGLVKSTTRGSSFLLFFLLQNDSLLDCRRIDVTGEGKDALISSHAAENAVIGAHIPHFFSWTWSTNFPTSSRLCSKAASE